jgi:hypothetical protein
MFAPEYPVGFRVLREKIGLWATLGIAIPACFNALRVKHNAQKGSDDRARVGQLSRGVYLES